jgi:hypothetical protein
MEAGIMNDLDFCYTGHDVNGDGDDDGKAKTMQQSGQVNLAS